MTVFLLVRHAAHDNVGAFLAGRKPGIHLGTAGREQAKQLAERLKREPIRAIYTSPCERTRETADAIATLCGLPEPSIAEGLNEIDFGSWSGRTFDDLNEDWAFRRWNEVRSLSRTPAGESMLDVQLRVLRHMEKVAAAAEEDTVALVTHADVIKAAVSYYLGLPVDAWPRLEISPASITTLVVSEWGAKLTSMNEVIW